ncbi:BTB/POZ domain-containing protein POB1 [Acorus gramineus]|uniref:BTB/POZ domain-containing protein POB1 n=1 Tax=Acorus gramineus TaxID=55184 RepID=A0AAV9ALJ4_ACOGR|nr:BTB/POZ domain-containing protein POB1 [Acorus gramineus]
MQIEIFDDEYESKRSLRVKQIYISSLVLAAKSEFFLKLFSNGMKESQPNCMVKIRIYDSEEDAFMEILNFMYGMKLMSTTMKCSYTLFTVMMLADKFEIISCVEQCVQLLVDLPMTREFALLYFDIPMRREHHPLINEATRFLASSYMDLTKPHDEIYDMPTMVMEAILSSDKVRVSSEGCIYDIVLKWARKQYPRLEDRRAFLGSCITRLVRFPYLRFAKLREVLACEDLDHDFAKDVVDEAFFFKVDRQRRTWVPKTLQVESFAVRACLKCEVTFIIKLEEACEMVNLEDKLFSEKFYLGKRQFSFVAQHCKVGHRRLDSFGLFIASRDECSEVIVLDYTFSVKKRTEKDFVYLRRLISSFKKNQQWGFEDLICMPWIEFISILSPYFIDGVLRLKADISVM